MTTEQQSFTRAIIERHDAFLSPNYPRLPIAMQHGEGSRLFDADGREYLDLFSGFGATILGHCHRDLVEAVTTQAGRLWHVGNLLPTEPQTLAAKAIAEAGFAGQSFFSHSGADANEAAIKLARLYGREHPGADGPRYGIISANQSFHGRSFATMGATGQPKVREGFEPLPEGFVNVPYNDLEAVRQQIDSRTVGILIEPIQGEGGINLPDGDYLPGLRRLCDEHNLLLIFDEVWTGCGRTGRWFGYQHWDVTPDIMTLGKGIGGGMAVGAMCARPELAELYDARKQGTVRHATTLGGNCLAMAVTAKLFEVIGRDRLLDHASAMGARAVQRLERMQSRLGMIREIRGRGLFIGIELDLEAGAWFDGAAAVMKRCLEQGLLIGTAQQAVLRLAPPLVITPSELDEGIDRLERVLAG